jgi:amino acid transporter/nucleotide-binding universal stress UspA family protein
MAAEKYPIKFKLARVLDLSDATTIGIGALIGGGIFTLTGLALSFAGPSLILVVGLNGIIALMTALAYAELGSTFPEAGGAFIWVKKGLGNLAGHITGWISWFANAVACGLYSLSFAFYVGIFLFSVFLPLFGIHFSFTEGSFFQKIIAISMVLFIGWVNFKGVSGTGRLGKIIVYLEILILSTFAIFGLISFFKKPDLAVPFTPLFPMGFFGLFSAMGLMYIGFEGTEIIVQSGEELKNPRKNIPRAIFISLGTVCLLYLIIIFSALAGVRGEMPSWETLAQAGQGALVKASSFFMPGLEWVVILGGLLAAAAALNSTIFSSSHVSFAMGRAGSLPNFLAKIHPKYQTPYIAVILSTTLVLIIAAFLPLKEVAAVTDLLFIFLFIQLHLALIALRKKLPNAPRSFRVPLYPLPSLIAIFAYGVLVYQFFHVSPIGLAIVFFWILTGLLIYYAYSKPVETEEIEKEILFEEKFRITEKKKRRILLPIRPDSNWRDILALSISLAKEKDAEICILHIKEIPYPLQVKEEELQADKEFLEEALNLSRASEINTDAIFMTSRSISRAIMEIIQKESPDLLVLGWKGYTKMTGTRPKIFGRELDKILREANCDLIVARINHLDDLKNILLPCAGGPHAHFVGEVAGAIAGVFDSKINVVFVTKKNGVKKFDPKEKLKEILSLLDIPSHIPLKSEVLYVEHYSPQAVAYQIVQKSQDFGSVFMASARGRIFREMIFGNVPEIVARNSSSTLILVKHHQAIIEPFFSYIRSRF